jgi:hypothetical protein
MGVGIPGMHARLRQFGGDLKIRSGSKGTSLLAYVPLSAHAQVAALWIAPRFTAHWAAGRRAPVTRIATSRTGRGSVGEMDRALTSSQIGPPNLEKRSHGFHGPISAPSLLIALKPLKFVSMPLRISS